VREGAAVLAKLRDWLASSPAVTAIIGSGASMRAYPHGDVPQQPSPPGAYVTWAVIYSSPENHLSGIPRAERQTVQVDCWSAAAGQGAKQVVDLATAVRDALEAHGYMTAIIANERDPDTMRYRIGMRFDFWLRRPE
jgi:hypothetical protein